MPNRTKDLIKETFLNILDQTPFDKITVTDIVQTCGINRNTFYYHFQDIYHLVDEVMEDDFFNLRKEEVSYSTLKETLMAGLKKVRERKRSCYHLYRSEYREAMLRFLYRIVLESTELYFEVLADDLQVDSESMTIVERFYAHALVGTITDWLNANMNYDLETYLNKTLDIFQDRPRRVLQHMSDKNLGCVTPEEETETGSEKAEMAEN